MTPSGRSSTAVVAGSLLAIVLAGCGADKPATSPVRSASVSTSPAAPSTAPSTGSGTGSSSPTSPAATASPTPAPSAALITKLLVVLVENHSLDAMRREMPYTYRLARRYGQAVDYRATSHPSLPNYLAISGGDTFGVGDDRDPAAHVIHGPSVFGEALARGATARVYAEDMPGRCVPTNAGRYAVRHNPWTYFADERTACDRYDVPMPALSADARAGNLPAVGMVVPNTCHDAHDCPAATADAWIRDVIGGVLAGPDFRSGRLLVVITADEDDHTQGNLVLTTLVNPQLHRVVVRTPLDHYSLSRLCSEVLGAPPLRRARTAPSMAEAFRLSVGPAPGG